MENARTAVERRVQMDYAGNANKNGGSQVMTEKNENQNEKMMV